MKKSDRGGGMLDGIKSKLGFADQGAAADYGDEYYDDYGDEYGSDYGDGPYGDLGDYGDSYDNGAAGAYQPYAPVSTRPARGARPSRTEASSPKLVSIDDVRARTQVPESLTRDPLPPRRVSSAGSSASTLSSSSYRSDRTMVDSSYPAPAPSSPAATAAAREQRLRSEGLSSLFTPTTPAAGTEAAPLGSAGSPTAGADGFGAGGAGSATVATATANPSAFQAAGSFDPYEAYSGGGGAAHVPSRSLSVLKPASYGEAERVAKILKAGDAVVLSLRNTPDQLAKRILDFSFGVSSALDASVECIADKVFALTRGAALSDAERVALRNQGVL